ncbi:MAG: SUMF1/EgtB/PvdO family nonheme iron enzyme [Fibrobacteria bacterium]|nr:SUMF1/EgtB/PvdO family nonheme iron enzyme [Fibrobacteria bacterium]
METAFRLSPATFLLLVLLPFHRTSGLDISESAGALDDLDAPSESTFVPPVRDTATDGTELAAPAASSAPARRNKRSPGVAPSIVEIPPGCFLMGNPDSVGGANSHPAHEVCLDGFRLDRIHVTQREYVEESGTAPWDLCEGPMCTPGNPDHPAWFVTWREASDFCRARGGRLPTEAEYEYAARAGDTAMFTWGNDPLGACRSANLADLTLNALSKGWRTFGCKDGSALVEPSGSRAPNRWGLYDMSGNVWSWTADWYASDTYSKSRRDDPAGPDGGRGKVIRGGSWMTGPDGALAGYRDGLAPGLRYIGSVGFRCAYPTATPHPVAGKPATIDTGGADRE